MADASPARHIPSMTGSRKGVSLSTSAPQVRLGREMTQREVGIPDEVDRGSPLFFLSYAHSQTKRDSGVSYERNRWFVKFFEDLSENVAELVSRPAGSDPGYMDQWIAAGRLWTPDLLNAIGTCQVFVALLSPIYIDRDWCGMEWHGFSRRRVISYPESRATTETAIIPVTWAPVREQDLPPIVQKVRPFHPRDMTNTNQAASYENDGVVGLLRMDETTAYHAVVWRLAQRIAEIHYTHRVKPRVSQVDELRNVFKEQQA